MVALAGRSQATWVEWELHKECLEAHLHRPLCRAECHLAHVGAPWGPWGPADLVVCPVGALVDALNPRRQAVGEHHKVEVV